MGEEMGNGSVVSYVSPGQDSTNLKGVTLAEEQTSKYLGVDIQSNLSFKNHISQVTKKANNMLGT